MHKNFQKYYEAHSDAFFKYIYYLVGKRELAEDLTKETFYRAFGETSTVIANLFCITYLASLLFNNNVPIFLITLKNVSSTTSRQRRFLRLKF